jgi:outer membrane protein TolC
MHSEIPMRIALLLALAGAACAQEPLKLTLKDAVALALKQNPRIILAQLGVSQSEQDRALARSALLPQVGGNLSETVHRVNLEAAIGFRFPGFAQHVGPYETFQLGAAVNAPVWDLTLWRRYRASNYSIDAARADETTTREDSVLLVVSQYLGSQRAAAEIQAAQSRVELAQALYDLAADLQKNGVGTGIDTLRSNVQLQNETQRLIVARTQLETSLFGLARLLSIDPGRKIELADQVSFFETPAIAADQTLERAYAARPELRRIRSLEDRATLEERTAGDARLPRLSVTGVWMEQGLAPNSAIPVYQYQGNIDFPLFTGGRIQAERAKASIATRQLKEQERETRDRIALEVKTAIVQLESARSEVEVANLGIQLARQTVDQARDRFQAGVANNVEVITAQDDLARAADNQIAALYRYNQARAAVAHATGQMESLYAK